MKAVTVAIAWLFVGLGVWAQSRDYPVKPVPFTAVHVNDEFWAPRIEINRTVTIPFAFKKDEETGRVDNFIRAAKALRLLRPLPRLPKPWEFGNASPKSCWPASAMACASRVI